MRVLRGGPEDYVIERIRTAGQFAVDTETVDTKDYTCIGIGVYVAGNIGGYFEVFPDMDEFVPELMGILADTGRLKIYFNGGNFDLPVFDMLAEGEGLTPPDDENIQDAEIMAKVMGLPGGLQRIGEDYLGADDLFSIKSLFEEFHCRNMLDVPFHRVAEKCLNDCRTTWAAYEWATERLLPAQRDCYETDRRLVPLLRRIERKGLALRQGILEEKHEALRYEVGRIERECAEEGFMVSSPFQVGFILAGRGNHLPLTKSKRQLRTDNEILEELDDPLAATVLDYRGKAKLLSTYVEPWIGKERAYTHFRLDLATGRLASGKLNDWDSTNRNLQNIPPDMRQIFRPDSGNWMWPDHGQIELRTLAFVSRDRVMMEAYKNGEDLHSLTAQRAGVPRDAGKTGNFSMVYGAADKVISKRAHIPLAKVPAIRGAFRELYAGAQRWIDGQFYGHNGEWVEDTIWGRRMRLPEASPEMVAKGYNKRAFGAHVSKCAVNYPIQSAAATVVKKGMLLIDSWGMDMKLQVHDEYLLDGKYEIPDELSWIHPEMHTPFSTSEGHIWK
jgi:DNA polymerase-1